MKPATVHMLRAHLMVASLTAMSAQLLACAALCVMPLSPATFSTLSFRLLALAVILSGVLVARRLAQHAFERALRGRHAIPLQSGPAARFGVTVTENCPHRELVILHLRFTGRPLVPVTH